MFKLINLTRFILELMTVLTPNKRKKYAQHTNLLYNRFRENRQCRMRTIKTILGVDTSLTGDYKFEQKTG